MPDTSNSVTLDEDVALEIHRLQDAYGVDSVNEVLRQALDVVPDAAVSEAFSMLPESLRPAAGAAINALGEIRFSRQVDPDASVVRYADPDESERILVEITLTPTSFEALFLDESGDLVAVGGGRDEGDGVTYWTADDEDVAGADVVTAIRDRGQDIYRNVLFDESAYTGC